MMTLLDDIAKDFEDMPTLAEFESDWTDWQFQVRQIERYALAQKRTVLKDTIHAAGKKFAELRDKENLCGKLCWDDKNSPYYRNRDLNLAEVTYGTRANRLLAYIDEMEKELAKVERRFKKLSN